MRPWVCWGCFDVRSERPVCAEGAHSQLAATQWLHLSSRVNTHRGGPRIWPFSNANPPQRSILCDNEQIPIQKSLLFDGVALWCPQHTWVNEWEASAVSEARSRLNVTPVIYVHAGPAPAFITLKAWHTDAGRAWRELARFWHNLVIECRLDHWPCPALEGWLLRHLKWNVSEMFLEISLDVQKYDCQS